MIGADAGCTKCHQPISLKVLERGYRTVNEGKTCANLRALAVAEDSKRNRSKEIEEPKGLEAGREIILKAVATQVPQVLLALGVTLLPHFATAIYFGYFAYKYGSEVLDLKKDYDQMTGEPEEKMAILAVRESVALVVSQIVGEEFAGAITSSVQTEADDLRYFYETTAESTLNAVIRRRKNSITDYVTTRVIRS